MKRFHVHAHVTDLKASIAFYSKLFAAEPQAAVCCAPTARGKPAGVAIKPGSCC